MTEQQIRQDYRAAAATYKAQTGVTKTPRIDLAEEMAVERFERSQGRTPPPRVVPDHN